MPGWYRTAAAGSWRVVVISAAGYVVMYSLVHLRVIVLPIIVALLASTLLLPLARWLKRRGLPDAAAAAVAMLTAFALLALILTLIAPSIAGQFGELRTQAEDGVRQASDQLAQPPFNLSEAELRRRVHHRLDPLRQNSGPPARGAPARAGLRR